MLHPAAALWGRLVGRYSRWVVRPDRVAISFAEPLTGSPSIWICWHEANLAIIPLHRMAVGRPVVGVAAGGASGSAVAAWMAECGIRPVRVIGGARAGCGLRILMRALRAGADVLMAVDGPAGPRYRPKPGGLWLAARSGAPVRAVGVAAAPALRVPRWDRQLVPLPGAHLRVRVGRPLRFRSGTRDAAALDQAAQALHEATAQAEAVLQRHHRTFGEEAARW